VIGDIRINTDASYSIHASCLLLMPVFQLPPSKDKPLLLLSPPAALLLLLTTILVNVNVNVIIIIILWFLLVPIQQSRRHLYKGTNKTKIKKHKTIILIIIIGTKIETYFFPHLLGICGAVYSNIFRFTLLEQLVCVLLSAVVVVGFFRATEIFPCTEGFLPFFLRCKANARVYVAKTGHGPHSS